MAVSMKTGRENMRLTQSTRLLERQHEAADFPTKQLFFLAICRVAEPIALTSIFPYSWLMVKSFNIGSKTDASFYAGVLISAFSFSECLTGMFWGGLSDRIGRKPVLLLGCAGTMLSLVMVGFSTNYWAALTGRVLGGALNGNIGVIQTMVGELVKKPEHEPRAYSVMPFVWSIGTIIGPAIGGTFANPTKFFPQYFSPDGIFGQYPYLLPNLICAALMLFSICLGWLFLEETHPYIRLGLSAADIEISNEALVEVDVQISGDMTVKIHTGGYGTFGQSQAQDYQEVEQQTGDSTTEKPIAAPGGSRNIFTFQILMLLLALGLFSYHSMCFDHLLPIFLQDSAEISMSGISRVLPPGMGMSTFQVGTILSVSGISALFIQGVVFPLLASYISATRLLILVTLLHPLEYFPMPFLAALPKSLVYPGIYGMLSFRNFTGIIAYPLLLILIKQACPCNTVLGKVNGLAASVGAASRMIAPPLAGYLYDSGTKIGFTGLAWWFSGLVAIIGGFQIFLVKRGKASAPVVVYERVCTDDTVLEVMGSPGPEILNASVIRVNEDV